MFVYVCVCVCVCVCMRMHVCVHIGVCKACVLVLTKTMDPSLNSGDQWNQEYSLKTSASLFQHIINIYRKMMALCKFLVIFMFRIE